MYISYTAAVPHLSLYHPFSLGVYFDCIGNESSLADCVATESLLCNFQNIAGVQCIGEIVEGKFYYDAVGELYDRLECVG